MRRRSVTVLSLAITVVLALVVSGCGGEDTPTVIDGFQVADVFEVKAKEYSFDPSSITIDRFGYYGIEVKNDGDVPHAFALKGPGIVKRTGTIQPGDSTTFAVYFKEAGTYTYTCPLDDHAAKGMKGTIRVH